MKNSILLPTTIAACLAALAISAQAADKKGKSKTDKVIDTAQKVIDALVGDKKKGPGAERVDEAVLGQQAELFAGAYRADNAARR